MILTGLRCLLMMTRLLVNISLVMMIRLLVISTLDSVFENVFYYNAHVAIGGPCYALQIKNPPTDCFISCCAQKDGI